MSDETTILPCPFCGGEAEVKIIKEFFGCDGESYYVRCRNKNCHAMQPETNVHETEAEAIEVWNTRAAYEAEGYFFLPKPKEQLFYTTPLGIRETENGYVAQTGFQVIEEAAGRWAKEIDDEILRRIIECWNTRAERTCKWTLHEQWQNAEGNDYVYGFKTECGAQHTWWPDSLPNYCPSCGAKVVEQ